MALSITSATRYSEPTHRPPVFCCSLTPTLYSCNAPRFARTIMNYHLDKPVKFLPGPPTVADRGWIRPPDTGLMDLKPFQDSDFAHPKEQDVAFRPEVLHLSLIPIPAFLTPMLRPPTPWPVFHNSSSSAPCSSIRPVDSICAPFISASSSVVLCWQPRQTCRAE